MLFVNVLTNTIVADVVAMRSWDRMERCWLKEDWLKTWMWLKKQQMIRQRVLSRVNTNEPTWDQSLKWHYQWRVWKRKKVERWREEEARMKQEQVEWELQEEEGEGSCMEKEEGLKKLEVEDSTAGKQGEVQTGHNKY